MEELITAATRTFLTFLQGFNQGFRCLLGSRQVAYVLLLDRIDSTAILHIDEVDDSKLAAFGKEVLFLVLSIVVVELGGQGWELIVVHYHGEALLGVLSDIRLDNREGLT